VAPPQPTAGDVLLAVGNLAALAVLVLLRGRLPRRQLSTRAHRT
jgi:hypothetical protein